MIARSVLAAIALFALQTHGFVANSPALSYFSAAKMSPIARLPLRSSRAGGFATWTASAELKEQLKGARQAIAEMIDKTNANPILVMSILNS